MTTIPSDQRPHKPAPWALKDLYDLLDSFSHDVRWSHIDLQKSKSISQEKRYERCEVTFVIHTTTGTLKASAMDRCSFDIPINPALAPTIKMTQDGAPEVRPYSVVFRYRSWPARSDGTSLDNGW